MDDQLQRFLFRLPAQKVSQFLQEPCMLNGAS
jgi:hypothetical protein